MITKNLWGCAGMVSFLLLCRAVSAEDGLASQKLDKVLENQERILKKLDEVKDELQVVKVRASNR